MKLHFYGKDSYGFLIFINSIKLYKGWHNVILSFQMENHWILAAIDVNKLFQKLCLDSCRPCRSTKNVATIGLDASTRKKKWLRCLHQQKKKKKMA